MGNKVAIVTDSTAYLPQEWIDKFDIKIAGSIVIFGDEQLRDYYDISAQDFFKRLAVSEIMPTTAQPTPQDFKEIYEPLLAAGYDILGIHISHKLSGTFASAESARAMFPDANIENIDSLSASLGEGWPLYLAAQAAQAGKSLAECKAIVEEACQHTYTCFAVETLEFLHRGGRIGGASRFFGTALNLKPLLEIKDGRIDALEKIRTRKKSLKRLAEVVVVKAGNKNPIYLGVLHANAESEAQELLDGLASQLDPKATVLTYVSPAVGTHTGPGTIGISIMAGYDPE